MKHWETLRRQGKTDDPSWQQLWDGAEAVGTNFKPDVEQGLRRLKGKIAQEGDAKVVALRPRRSFLRIAVAAAIVLVAGWAVWNSQAIPAASVDWMAVATTTNEVREVVLPDGSTVTLNENSEIRYPSDLNTAIERTVELSGEAFFDVTRRTDQAFEVRSPLVYVSVLGTSFNVRAQPGSSLAEVEVSSGKVAVQHPTSQAQVVLLPNEKAQVTANAPINKVSAPFLNGRSWQTGRLKFRKTALAEALPAIERHFGIQLDVADEKMLSCTFTAQWDEADRASVLTALERFTGQALQQTGPNTYKIKGNCR